MHLREEDDLRWEASDPRCKLSGGLDPKGQRCSPPELLGRGRWVLISVWTLCTDTAMDSIQISELISKYFFNNLRQVYWDSIVIYIRSFMSRVAVIVSRWLLMNHMFKIAGDGTGHERTRGRRPVSYNCFIMAIAKGERRMLFFVGIAENGRDGYVVYSFSYCSLTYLVLGTNMAIKFDLPKSWCLKPFNYYQNLFILWTCRTIHCVEMAYLHWSKHKRTIGCIVCLEHHCR